MNELKQKIRNLELVETLKVEYLIDTTYGSWEDEYIAWYECSELYKIFVYKKYGTLDYVVFDEDVNIIGIYKELPRDMAMVREIEIFKNQLRQKKLDRVLC